MELNVVENKKGRLLIEIKGEDHTFCNAIKEELLNDKDVKVATYSISHPLTAFPVMIIEAVDPQKSLLDAAKRLNKNIEKLNTLVSSIK